MTNPPNLAFDIDALFDHLINNLEHDIDNEMEWIFTFVNRDTESLERFAESIADGLDEAFELGLVPVAINENNSITERTDLMACILGALTPEEVKEIHNRFIHLASDSDTTYIGVTCSEPYPDDIMDYKPLDEAIARLQYLTETGLTQNEPIPFNFAIECETVDVARDLAKTIVAANNDGSLHSVDVITDDEPGAIVDVQFNGQNNEQLLTTIYNKIEKHATAANADLLGVTHIEEHEHDENCGCDEEE